MNYAVMIVLLLSYLLCGCIDDTTEDIVVVNDIADTVVEHTPTEIETVPSVEPIEEVVIIMDNTASVAAYDYLDYEKALVLNMIQGISEEVIVITFDGELVDDVQAVRFSHGSSELAPALIKANNLISNGHIIVISDGAIDCDFNDCMNVSFKDSIELHYVLLNTGIIQEQLIKTDYNQGEYLLKVLADNVDGTFIVLESGQRIDLVFMDEPGLIELNV